MNDHSPPNHRTWSIPDLEYWEQRISEKVLEFGLDCYPQEFEVCDPTQMLSIMAYSGMPSHYPHWSYGKSFERQKTMYDHGVAGLPYEMVINSDPCLAYLMRDNSLCLQITTIAHVYGHNDFFKNNFTFSFTHAARVIEQFKAHADRVRSYVESPSIGYDRVERILDAAHALSFNCRRNPAIRKRTPEEQRQRALALAEPKKGDFSSLQKQADYVAPDLHRVPLEPDEDILLFIANYNRRLESWERDLLTIAHEEAQYFLPQIETKIMNEGWASYWHRTIMNSLELPSDIQLEFIVRHNQVVRPVFGDINPYHVGLKIWDDIERRHTNPSPRDIELFGEPKKSAREAMFEIRETDRDASFLRRFLSEDLIREMDLFQYGRKHNGDSAITHVADNENWRVVKDTLIKNVGMGSFPVIQVLDGDYLGKGDLLLEHVYDGRELQLEYAEKTMRHINQLWGRKVYLETQIDNERLVLSYDNDTTFTKCSAHEVSALP